MLPPTMKKLVKSALRWLNLTASRTINGRRFRIPIIKGIGGSNLASFEPWMVDFLTRLRKLEPRGAFADVGVNIGQTLLKVKSIDPAIRYIGFEPNPFCVLYVGELIRINRLANCDLVPVGLSEACAVVPFVIASDADTAGSMITDLRGEQGGAQRRYIPVVQFDALVGEVLSDDIAIIKIDVEGAELEALRGMRQFLSTNRPYVSCEVLHAHSSAQVPMVEARNSAITNLLEEIRYDAYRIVKERQERVIGLEAVDQFETGLWDPVTSPARCDYLLVPREKADTALGEFGAA